MPLARLPGRLRTVLVAVLALVAQTSCATLAVDGFPSHVRVVAAPGTYDGDLSAGRTMDLAFAARSSMACFPATENANFQGLHVLYATDLPAGRTLQVTVTPAAGVDVSVYAYTMATNRTDLPPDVQSAVSCEAGYDQVNDSNPGQPETLALTSAANPYQVVVGVAGAKGVASGAYSLSLTWK